jgi:lactate dehydrogenase-like 2-hydroxyacid dehydrogenase
VLAVTSAKRDTIGILGTGAVGTTLAASLRRAGHSIVFGSRSPSEADLPDEQVTSYTQAAHEAEIVLNATPGQVSCGRADRSHGSRREMVVARSILRSNEAIAPTPVASAWATRYASAKSRRSSS